MTILMRLLCLLSLETLLTQLCQVPVSQLLPQLLRCHHLSLNAKCLPVSPVVLLQMTQMLLYLWHRWLKMALYPPP